MLTRKKVQTSVLLVFGIIVLINIIASEFFFRLDFTEDKRYSLSDATENILENLNNPVTVSAYFTENLPPDIEKVRTDFKDLLVEYSNAADGQVVYEFIDPAVDEQTEMEAQQAGIRPIMINVREKDQLKQQKAYLGAIVRLGDKQEVLPFIEPGAAMEFGLSSAIKKLSVDNKPKVGILTGNGEAGLSQIPQLAQQLSVLYEITDVELSDTTDIPSDINTILILSPKDSLSADETSKLDNYLARGGRIALSLNSVKGDLSNAQGSESYNGFLDWVKNFGVSLDKSFIIDASCASVSVRQQQGFFIMNTPVKFPYLPVITKFEQHPITAGLEAVLLPFASAINITPRDTSLMVYTLAKTSEKSGKQAAPVFFDVSKQWGEADFDESGIPVAVAIDGKFIGNTPTKMVVFGSGDFVVNGEGEAAQKLQDDNINLMINSVDWLSDDTGLISLRTKGVSVRLIDASIEDGTKAILKYFNFLFPIILIIIYGIFRYNLRKTLRNKLSTVEYVQKAQ